MYRVLKANNDNALRYQGQILSIKLSLYQGKFKNALTETEGLIGNGDNDEQTRENRLPDVHINRGRIFSGMKNFPAAITEAEQIVRYQQQHKVNAPLYSRHGYVALLAQHGDLKKAEAVAAEIKKDIEQSGDTAKMPAYWMAIGWIERIERK